MIVVNVSTSYDLHVTTIPIMKSWLSAGRPGTEDLTDLATALTVPDVSGLEDKQGALS
jgi:hypothetical protein